MKMRITNALILKSRTNKNIGFITKYNNFVNQSDSKYTTHIPVFHKNDINELDNNFKVFYRPIYNSISETSDFIILSNEFDKKEIERILKEIVNKNGYKMKNSFCSNSFYGIPQDKIWQTILSENITLLNPT